MSDKKVTHSAILGVVLSILRQESGVEQRDMATRMGLTQASYSRLEGGKSAFSIDQMYQAADALGLTAREIIDRLDNYSSDLQSDGIDVQPQIRRNTTKAVQAQNKKDDVANFVAGAALSALIISILSKK